MNKENSRIVFMGTPEFAIPTLELLHKHNKISLVVTNPDKPAGRGLKPMPSPIKIKAKELGIPTLEPSKLSDPNFIRQLREIEPDLFVIVAFKILPKEVFTIPRIASFNVHPSLLPKYRGPAPINWQIINGEMKTGVTTFLLQEQVDTGNIILQREYDIPEGWTAGDLHDFLAPKSAEMALETCEILLSGNFTAIEQDETLATKAPKIYPEQCQIDWTMEARPLRNFIHGVSPLPGAYTSFRGKRFKIYRCDFVETTHFVDPGTFLVVSNKFAITCTNGYIFPKQVQIEGKRIMSPEEFLNGYKV
ncbi:MAG: methionyl-tRNA formyltransferase [Candidatus Kapaibacteriales bacterium]